VDRLHDPLGDARLAAPAAGARLDGLTDALADALAEPVAQAIAQRVGDAPARSPFGDATHLTLSFGVPVAHVDLTSDHRDASVDDFGLADLYLQPLKLGWRFTLLEVVTASVALTIIAWQPGGR
jgi:hypothetical protein